MGLEKARVLKITPIQGVKATGTWTHTDLLVTGTTLIIGSETYQANADSAGVTVGNIAFGTGLGATCATSVNIALIAIVNASSALVTAATGASASIMTLEYLTAGEVGNVHCTGSATGTWAATSLAGGVNGTVAKKGTIAVDASYLYFTKDDNDVFDQNWYMVTGTLLT